MQVMAVVFCNMTNMILANMDPGRHQIYLL